MPLPRYDDHHPSFSAPGYGVVNEEPEAYRKLLKNHHIRKCGSIVSGGEVLLFSILSRSSGEVIGVDHSYRSLAACWAKVLLLDALGPEATRALLTSGDSKAVVKAIVDLSDKFPETLRQSIVPGYQGGIAAISRYEITDSLRREWHYVPKDVLARVCKKLDRLTLMHGDISDLSKYGELDCLYVSNAAEHSGRERRSPTLKDFSGLLKENGILLFSRYSPELEKSTEPSLTRSEVTRGYRTTWVYHLFTKVQNDSSGTSN